MSIRDDRPEVDTCDRCDLIAYPLHICEVGRGDPNSQRLCGTCVKEHAFELECRSCNETMLDWTRDDHARA